MFGAMGIMAALALGAVFVPMVFSEDGGEDEGEQGASAHISEPTPDISAEPEPSANLLPPIPEPEPMETDAEFNGNDYDNFHVGDDLNELIRMYGGDDHVRGGSGRDAIFGGAGDDTLKSGPGDDLLWGEEGDDLLIGGFGKDYLYGGDGDDDLMGWDDDDVIFTGTGKDEVLGGHGNDLIIAEEDTTRKLLNGGTGDDTIYAGKYDLVSGGGGSDDIFAKAQAEIEMINFTSGSDKLLVVVPPEDADQLPELRLEVDEETGYTRVFSGDDLVATVLSGSIVLSDVVYVFDQG